MMIKGFILALALSAFSLGNSKGNEILIPQGEEIIARAEVILIVKCLWGEQKVEGRVVGVIKGNPELMAKTVSLKSPYPEMSFPFNKWMKECDGQMIIVLGILTEPQFSVSLIFGPGSVWPNGTRFVFGKNMNLSESVDYLQSVQKRSGL